MSPRHLILVRHGESEFNVANRAARIFCGQFDSPLTARGREQACEAGKVLGARGDLRIARIASSALSRARETLELLAPHLPQAVQVVPALVDLNERSLGLFENRTEADVFQEFPQYRDDDRFNRFQNDFVHKAPQGENLTDVTGRAWSAIKQLLADPDGDLVVVSHGVTIRCIMGQALGLSPTEVIQLRIPNAVPIILRRVDGYAFERLE